MNDSMVALRYVSGGGSLTFRDATHPYRTVRRGEPFETDAPTAAILLADPDVIRVDETEIEGSGVALSVVPADQPLEDLTVAQLRELAAATGLEIPAKARKADLVAALAEAEPVAEDEPDTAPSDETDAPRGTIDELTDELSDEEAFARPDGEPVAGTISLGDLPPSARIAPEQG